MNRTYFRFDSYLIGKMLGKEWEMGAEKLTEEMRQQAYRICLQKMGQQKIASYQTIQRWFGIHGWSRPNREKLFELGFALEFSDYEAREMFVKGAMEPDFQVNDYREMTFLYGFEQSLGYEECLEMIDEFALALPGEFQVVEHNYTADIWESYGANCHLDRDSFLGWMKENAIYFKGYSKTVLGYFMDLKREILEEVKRDAAIRLDELLGETGFLQWERIKHLSRKKRNNTIPQFLKRKRREGFSEELEKIILELLQMSGISEASNSELLTELYADVQFQYKIPNTRRKCGDLRILDDKYLSDLLNVGVQKERLINLLLREVKEDNKELSHLIKEQRKRCHLIERQDILPLILCVSQKRYLRKGKEYCAEDAKKSFINFANRILTSCQMVSVNEERYELDALLCSCFREGEMYMLSDVLEEYLSQRNKQ